MRHGGLQVYTLSSVCVCVYIYTIRRVATSGSSFLLAFPSVEMGYVIIETQHRVPGASKSHVRICMYIYIHTYIYPQQGGAAVTNSEKCVIVL